VLKISLHTNSAEATPAPPCCTAIRPRLLNLDGIDIEAPLQGTLITLRNLDVPGVIGRIGTILGEHRINIANFALGRSVRSKHVPQGSALAVVQVDGEVTAKTLDALRAAEGIVRVGVVGLDGV
jgi:D-3-phosphoglycerate dehydrogenase